MHRVGLSRDRVAAYVDRFAKTRVWVVGDVMLDRYVWGIVDRISPEAPVPVVKVTRRSARLGGAANVAANLRALGVHVTLAGVVGDDRVGGELRSLLESEGIATEFIGVEKGRDTTEKIRIIAQSQQVVRADCEVETGISEASQERFLSGFAEQADRFDALIVSDYGKGVVQEKYLREFIALWRTKGKAVLVDPHVGHFPWYRGATLITPNTKQAASFFGATPHSELFSSLGFRMRRELELEALLITRGDEGMSLFCDDDKRIDIPAVAKEVYDVTGAGDTVISTLGAALGSGATLLEAVVMANQAAGEVVKEVGTSVIAKDKLVRAFDDFS